MCVWQASVYVDMTPPRDVAPLQPHSLHPPTLASPCNAVMGEHEAQLLNLVQNFQLADPAVSLSASAGSSPSQLGLLDHVGPDLPERLGSCMRESALPKPWVQEAFRLCLRRFKDSAREREIPLCEVAMHDPTEGVTGCQLASSLSTYLRPTIS